MIRRPCHLGDRACVSNFAHATTRRRGHGRGRSRRGSGQASERKHDEEEALREVDTMARKAEIEKYSPLVHPNILLIFIIRKRIVRPHYWYSLFTTSIKEQSRSGA